MRAPDPSGPAQSFQLNPSVSATKEKMCVSSRMALEVGFPAPCPLRVSTLTIRG